MKYSKRKTAVTRSLFANIKKAMKDGYGSSEIREYFNISKSTYSRIGRAENYADYKNYLKTIHKPVLPAKELPPLGGVKIEHPPMIQKTADTEIPTSNEEVLKAIKALSAEFRDVRTKIEELNDTYAWVVEHAQIDTSKKRRGLW